MISTKQYSSVLNTAVAAMIMAAAAIAPQAAIAAPIYSADTLLGSVNPGSSRADLELALIRSYAKDPLLVATKVETGITAIADGGQWYIDVGTATPGYFMLKFGTGTTNQNSHYFFRNDGLVGDTKLVWTNEQVNFLTGGGNCFIPDAIPSKRPKAPDLSSCNSGRLSHFAFGGAIDTGSADGGDNGGGGPTEVPEPGSLALAGLGLLGVASARKKLAK